MKEIRYCLLLVLIYNFCPAQTYFSHNYDINYASETGLQIARSGDKIVVLTGALCRVDTGGFDACT